MKVSQILRYVICNKELNRFLRMGEQFLLVTSDLESAELFERWEVELVLDKDNVNQFCVENGLTYSKQIKVSV